MINNNDNDFFSLLLKKTDGSSMTYRFAQEASLGADPRNDIILVAPKVGSKFLHFKNKEGCLSLNFLGLNESASLNQVKLLKNKMYILEKEDIIQIGLNKIVIL